VHIYRAYPTPPDRRATASGRLGPETGSFRFPCPRHHQSCLTLSTTEPAADPTVLDRHTTTPASPSQPHFSLAIHGKAPHSQPRHTSRAPFPPPRPYSPFSLAIRRKAPHFQPSHTLQDASLSALPYVAGRPTLPAWPVVITRRVAACEKEATRPPTIVRGTFATRERCTMRARQVSARTRGHLKLARANDLMRLLVFASI